MKEVKPSQNCNNENHEMDAAKFSRVADSLRQYRRAELKDFATDIGGNPIDELYVDPLPSEAVLSTIMSGNTTFLTGRKGTGKSTIFAKAQSEIRKRKDLISVYVDVKSLYELASGNQAVAIDKQLNEIEPAIYQAHMLRKNFLGEVLHQLLVELESACESLTLRERWFGRKRGYKELIRKLESISERVSKCELAEEELPILRQISAKAKNRDGAEDQKTRSASLSGLSLIQSPSPRD